MLFHIVIQKNISANKSDCINRLLISEPNHLTYAIRISKISCKIYKVMLN